MKSTFLKNTLFTLTAIAGLTQTAFAGNEIAKTQQNQTVYTVMTEGKIYSEAHRKSLSKNMQSTRYQNGDITMAANIYFPENFDKSKKYPAIIVGHPGGGVKEQASGLYAKMLAEKGFVAIAFDASHQGESGGYPRLLEDPEKRIGDFHATVDYLTTLPYVDSDKIGMLGICASGGYTVAATTKDPRIKALATVSAFVRHNTAWDGTPMTDEQKQAFLKQVNDQRTAEANGAPLKYTDVLLPVTKDTPKDLADAYEYYLGERGYYPTAQNKFLFSGLSKAMNFDALNGTDTLLTQPLLVIAGDEADSRWQSELVYETAKSAKEKELFIIKGANHMTMYDSIPHVSQAIDKMDGFFKANLK
ncbi:alpha/beta hydrolase [Actinobacillus vicugnae]|uniref:alpha/beta hydrolase n=1 Tax=Actinobacillus vicugnae TaxID=2573093 RepID=UPI001AD73ECF|nr:alpha/beta hydrolase [Actinobacillus vicugnae]